MMGYYSEVGNHMGFTSYGIFIQIVLFLAFLLIMFWVIRSSDLSNESAEEILKKRLAKGEINKKEYESLKKEISK